MKQAFLFLILTLFCISVFAQQKINVVPVKPGKVLREKILQQIQVFSDAWAASDTATLCKLLTNEYQHTDVWGKILHKQDWLMYAGAPRKISGIVISGDEILLYNNNIALVTGKMSYQVGEEKITQEIRFTQIWSYDGVQWKRSAVLATLVDRSKK